MCVRSACTPKNVSYIFEGEVEAWTLTLKIVTYNFPSVYNEKTMTKIPHGLFLGTNRNMAFWAHYGTPCAVVFPFMFWLQHVSYELQ